MLSSQQLDWAITRLTHTITSWRHVERCRFENKARNPVRPHRTHPESNGANPPPPRGGIKGGERVRTSHELQFTLTAFAAIFAVLNPFSIIPIFLAINEGTRPGVRRSMAGVISIFVVIALTLCLIAGEAVLTFFGISIPAFQIAGGILLFSTGLGMIHGTSHFIDRFVAKTEDLSSYQEARARFRDLIVPIGTPLFVGPGSISTVILMGNRAKVFDNPFIGYGLIVVACLACAIATYIILLSSSALVRVLRTTGIAILSRLMGLLLCALAIQFVITALRTLLPSLFK